MRSFDLLSGANKQITKQTWLGGVLSLVILFSVVMLLRNESESWSDKRLTKTIFVDNIKPLDSVSVTLYITLPNCPCALLSLDNVDSLKNHRPNLPIDKIRVTKDNEPAGPVNSSASRR